MSESSPTLAELIRRALAEGRTTRERIARRSGRSVGTVSNWITCDWLVPQKDAWPSLCLELGVSLDELKAAIEATQRVKPRGEIDERQVHLVQLIDERRRAGVSVARACREAGISPFSYYRWRTLLNATLASEESED